MAERALREQQQEEERHARVKSSQRALEAKERALEHGWARGEVPAVQPRRRARREESGVEGEGVDAGAVDDIAPRASRGRRQRGATRAHAPARQSRWGAWVVFGVVAAILLAVALTRLKETFRDAAGVIGGRAGRDPHWFDEVHGE